MLAVTAGGCDRLSGPQGEADFVAAVQRWQVAEPAAYSYTIQVYCYCLETEKGPVVVVVRDGVTESLTYQSDGSAADTTWFGRYGTVDQLLGIVRRALDDAAELSAEYAGNGVPVAVSIDWIKEAIDDELSFGVTSFTALP